jgi:hypothetical protein
LKSSEARRNPRFRCSFPAVVDGPRGALRGTCTNVSLGGLYVAGPVLPVGTNATVTIDLGAKGKLKFQAEVRHQSATPPGLGLQFTRFEPGQAEGLQALIAWLPK